MPRGTFIQYPNSWELLFWRIFGTRQRRVFKSMIGVDPEVLDEFWNKYSGPSGWKKKIHLLWTFNLFTEGAKSLDAISARWRTTRQHWWPPVVR